MFKSHAASIALALSALAIWTIDTTALAGRGFVEGDLYLSTHSHPIEGKAIVRIDPVTGVQSVLYNYDAAEINAYHTYDPFRARIVRSLTWHWKLSVSFPTAS